MFETRCGLKKIYMRYIYVLNIFFGSVFAANALDHNYFPVAYSSTDLELNVDTINTNVSDLSSLQISLNSPLPTDFAILQTGTPAGGLERLQAFLHRSQKVQSISGRRDHPF
jgi:hypothetical protein